MNGIHLKTEYLINPMGIDVDRPRLMWNCEGGITQTAYQIIAVNGGSSILWDSGKVESCSMRAQWGGAPIPARTVVTWKLRLWDDNGEAGSWSEAHFEMGLPKARPWTAQWISGNYAVDKKVRYPVDCFRKRFSVTDVKKARLYITACGLYEARLNGKRVGDFVLAPGHTDYRERVQYQTYDVAELLHTGENTITVQLADGWYRGSCGAWGLKNQYGTQTKLLAQLEVTGASGSVTTVHTDGTWEWSNDGPIRFADNKDGEIVDASLTASYGGHAQVVDHPVIPTASNNVPVTEHETFRPTRITTPSGKTVLDFGQNIAGYVAFSLTAKAGQRIKLRFGEMLDHNGEFTQKNIQCVNKKITTPLQQVEYLCREGENHYHTSFAIFGFQYILVETDVTFQPEDFTAIAVYSNMERTGWFESSNELLNRFVDCTLWSAKNNHADVPTDCPTRERHGWTGDSQIFFNTASFLLDYAALARKHLRDVFDWQRGDGNLPQIAPAGGVDFYMDTMNGSPGWSDVGILTPYRFWKKYGDRELLTQYYPGMKKYAAFLLRRCGKRTLLSKPLGLHGELRRYAVNYGQSYGEWAEPADVWPNDWKDMVLPHPEVSTAYTAYCFRLFAEMAEELGDTSTAKEYAALSEKVKESYQALRKLPEFSLDTDRQAMLARPLYMGLLDTEQTEYARKRLITALENYGWRLGTGFLSTPLILYVLAEYDLDAAYRLLENEEIPGWLSMPKNGATTVWEDWEGKNAQSGIASLNHYSKGAVVEWLFDTMCGIHMDGENHFVIAPHPGGHFTHARAHYDSAYGRVESGWRKEGGTTLFTVAIPSNCTAEVYLPSQKAIRASAGIHQFEMK